MPLWAQVLDDLRRRLAEGEFATGFPPERELIDQYGVSRHTVRDAMTRLREAGVIRRERGRGTFVRTTRIEQQVGTLYSLFRSIEEQGFEQRSKVLDLRMLTDADAARRLGMVEDAELVYLHRVRCADDTPIAIDEVWLPGSLAAPLLAVDFEHTAVYVELERRCGLTPRAGWEQVSPVLPSLHERELLGLSGRRPAFLVERFTESAAGPLEWRRTVIRGDRYSFVTRWGQADDRSVVGEWTSGSPEAGTAPTSR
jgi:GntR family transcriptional regulator